MPHVTLARQKDGWVLPVVVGVKGRTTANLVAAGLAVPPPQSILALLDTGNDITGVDPGILSRLGLVPIRQSTTQTLSGSLPVRLFEVSLIVSQPGVPKAPLLVLDQLIVMALPIPVSGADAVLGRDVADLLLLILDGPGKEMTVAD
jgi:hypothetical protein